MSKKFKIRQRLQIFNPSHKSDVLKLLSEASVFDVDEENNPNCPTLDDIEANLEDDDNVSSTTNNGDSESTSNVGEDESKAGLVCKTCDITFPTVIDQRQHFRLDWHRYNLKRKVHNQIPVTEEQFDEMMDGLSSISGSDGEDSQSLDNPLSRLMEKVTIVENVEGEKESKPKNRNQTGLKRYPKVFFKSSNNEAFSVYNSIFGHVNKNSDKYQPVELLRDAVEKLPLWGIIMISGGHFAAAVFKGTTEVLHKTFHSYTVRAKQGGQQGSKDGKSGTSHPKSAGSSLRRYNEQSFNQHVQELMSSWKEKLSQCQLIFYRAVSFNQNVLFGGTNPPLDKKDVRLKTIPMATKRPTYSEVKRVLSALSTVEIYGDFEEFKSILIKPSKSKTEENSSLEKRPRSKRKNIDRAKSRSPVKHEIPEAPLSSPEASDAEYHMVETMETIDLQADLQEYGDSINEKKQRKKPKKPKSKVEEFPRPSGTLGSLLTSIEEKNETLAKELIPRLAQEFVNDTNLWNQVLDSQSLTLLHHTCKNNLLEVLWLLMENGCDPSLKDKTGKYPYNWASTKDCRKVFQRFQAEYPDKYNYALAQVPGPLTKEMEEEKAEKQKLLNKLKREKEKARKMEKKEKQAELDEKDRFLNLSDREKRALAAERRILGLAKRNGEKKPILVRCFDCGADITGQVPFEYNSNVFCTTKCLAVHRKKFPTPLSL